MHLQPDSPAIALGMVSRRPRLLLRTAQQFATTALGMLLGRYRILPLAIGPEKHLPRFSGKNDFDQAEIPVRAGLKSQSCTFVPLRGTSAAPEAARRPHGRLSYLVYPPILRKRCSAPQNAFLALPLPGQLRLLEFEHSAPAKQTGRSMKTGDA